tara:strand:- start:785 stop:1459 length:675 start_codon:yes stop_codon:yes gene_type:complete
MNGRNEMNIPEYNVQVRVKNNYFLRRMAEKGFASSAALARACDVNVYRIGLYINLKRAPLTENNEWREDILRISAALNCMPDDLFPERHLRRALRKNTARKEMDYEQMQGITSVPSAETTLIGNEVKRMVNDALSDLEELDGDEKTLGVGMSAQWNSKRAVQIVRAYYFEGNTLAQIGKEFGLSLERIRQIIKGTERHLLRRLVGTIGPMSTKELLDDLTEMNR